MGVPAPAGAGLALYPLILWQAFRGEVEFFRCPVFASFFVIFAGVMMASRIPTVCLKHLHPNKTMRSVLGFVFLAFIAGLVASPWMALSLLGIVYIVSIPVGVCVFLKLKKKVA